MAMEQEFKGLLDRNKVCAEAAEWFKTIGCTSMKHFANWVDSRNEMAALVEAAVPKCKDSKMELANVKQAWRECDEKVRVQLKRSAEGLNEEAMEEPLNPERQESVETAFYNQWK